MEHERLQVTLVARMWRIGSFLVDGNGKIYRYYGHKGLQEQVCGRENRYERKRLEARNRKFAAECDKLLVRYDLEDVIELRDRIVASYLPSHLRVAGDSNQELASFQGGTIMVKGSGWSDRDHPVERDDLVIELAKGLLRTSV